MAGNVPRRWLMSRGLVSTNQAFVAIEKEYWSPQRSAIFPYTEKNKTYMKAVLETRAHALLNDTFIQA